MNVTCRNSLKKDAYFPHVAVVREYTSKDKRKIKEWLQQHLKLDPSDPGAYWFNYKNVCLKRSNHKNNRDKCLYVYFKEDLDYFWFIQNWS